MKNLALKASSISILLLASGCFETKQDAAAIEDADPRIALIAALDNQATSLVDGINKVVINGQFLKNMNLENPPEPISLENENDVNKAIQYLLSDQSTLGNSTIYHPDSKICSELIAKENPKTCVQLMADVTLIQTPLDATTGYVEVNVAGAKPLLMSYSPSGLSANSQVAEVVKTLLHISEIGIQNGEEDFADKLPTTYEGEVQLVVTNEMGFSIVTASIIQAIDIKGHDNENAYGLQAQVSQNAVVFSLNGVLGLAQASVSLPQLTLTINPMDEQHQFHQVQIHFPGASGSLSLDNSLETMALQALRLNASDIYIDVDGQNAVHGMSNDQIDASIHMAEGGDGSITFSKQFSAQVIFSANSLINKTGTLSGSVAEGTQVLFPHAMEQGKVLSGSIDLLGTLDFTGSMTATAGLCIEGKKDAPVFLQTAVCKF